jgi:hypothetical protein
VTDDDTGSSGGAAPSRAASPGRTTPLRAALWTAAALGVVLGAASMRVVAAGEAEIAASTAALRAGDPRDATLHARRAAGWYAPGAPHVRVAYDRLIALATTAEGLGDLETAVYAWNAVRSSAIETRWLVTPHAEDLARADQAIARLSVAAPRPPGTRVDPPAQLERAALEALARDEAPRVGWVAALVVAFVTWSSGAIWVVRRAVDATGRLALSRAAPGLLAIAAGLSLWLLAIWRA